MFCLGVVGVTMEDLLLFDEDYDDDFRLGINEDYIDVLRYNNFIIGYCFFI